MCFRLIDCCVRANLLPATIIGHQGASAWTSKGHPAWDCPQQSSWGAKWSHIRLSRPRRCFAAWVQHFWFWRAELQWSRVLQTRSSPAFRTTVSSDDPRHATRSRSGNGSHDGQPPGGYWCCRPRTGWDGSHVKCELEPRGGWKTSRGCIRSGVFRVRTQCTRNVRQTGNTLTGRRGEVGAQLLRCLTPVDRWNWGSPLWRFTRERT